MMGHPVIFDSVVKTLHLLVTRPKEVPLGYEFIVTATYLSTPRSSKFTFLAYEVFHPNKGCKYLGLDDK